MLKLEISVGSTRETWSADLVVPWIERRAQEQGSFDVDVLDLRDWQPPMFADQS